LSLNCRSIRRVIKHNKLAALLDLHDIDIALGIESHIDQTFLSSEILPKTTKFSEKIGGGVYLLHLNII